MRRLSCVEKIDDIRDGTAAMHRVGNQRSCRCALKRGNSDFLGWATNAACLKCKRYRVGNVADTRSQSNVVSAEAIKQNRSIAAKADDVCLLAEREQKFCETLLRRHEKNTTATRFGCQTNVREIINKSTSPTGKNAGTKKPRHRVTPGRGGCAHQKKGRTPSKGRLASYGDGVKGGALAGLHCNRMTRLETPQRPLVESHRTGHGQRHGALDRIRIPDSNWVQVCEALLDSRICLE